MAVVTKYGAGYRDPTSLLSHRGVSAEGRARFVLGKVDVASGDSANSQHYWGKVPSDAIFMPTLCTFWHAGITGLTDYDFGFFLNGSEAVAGSGDALADGLTLATAGSKNALAAVATGSLTKRAWELAGFTDDPVDELDLVGTMKTAATAAGALELFLAVIKE